MNLAGLIILIVIILGALLIYKFIKSAVKILILVAIAAVLLFFVSKYTGFSIW